MVDGITWVFQLGACVALVVTGVFMRYTDYEDHADLWNGYGGLFQEE